MHHVSYVTVPRGSSTRGRYGPGVLESAAGDLNRAEDGQATVPLS